MQPLSEAIESRRLQRVEDAVEKAMSLWKERECSRAEILLALDAAEASLARRKGRIIIDESMRTVAAQVKQRGRARLLAVMGQHRLAPEAESNSGSLVSSNLILDPANVGPAILPASPPSGGLSCMRDGQAGKIAGSPPGLAAPQAEQIVNLLCRILCGTAHVSSRDIETLFGR